MYVQYSISYTIYCEASTHLFPNRWISLAAGAFTENTKKVSDASKYSPYCTEYSEYTLPAVHSQRTPSDSSANFGVDLQSLYFYLLYIYI
jgi:hypothetical protein